MAINNSTISAEISGSTIVVDIRVHLFTGNVNRRFKDGAYGYLKRSVNGGSYSTVTGNYSLPTGSEAFNIQKDITYTDSNVSNQNTYRYVFEMQVEEETSTRPLD